VLIIPLDDWYIIPYDVIGGMTTSLSITTNCKQAKYEEFREAWDLFLETGLTIQACCDDLINSHLHLRP
jgi:hypothetical protein